MEISDVMSKILKTLKSIAEKNRPDVTETLEKVLVAETAAILQKNSAGRKQEEPLSKQSLK